ncbi:serine hydrolase [Allokutzneria sp. NRRL B-24872]|uniref:serine hydrolase domain-containing protein n=1 Tax=Allokutzneria sp. NRRL B-24872 TaxID=1137961 RepID=UPI000A3C15E6|nr:serine hydrolase domain-containing protein [Allokutzneria sp. NRRL B-24872]
MYELMRRMVIGVVLVGLSLGLLAPTATARPEAAAIAEVVAANLGPTRLPGVAVAVVRDGQVLHTGGHGRDGRGEPLTDRTPMRIASLSKSFTALAVMQLVDAGRLRLDDPVTRHLPEFSTADPRSAQITVRQLLDHSSGLSDTTYPEAALPQPRSLREAVAALRGARLAAAPGQRHDYHNPNYWVAARVVEVLGGAPFSEHLARSVFAPLGMTTTVTVGNWRDPLPGLSDGHNRFLGVTWPKAEPDRFVAGSAGIVTTAVDLAKWLALHTGRAESPVLRRKRLEELHEISSPDAHYALGWDRPDVYGEPRQIAHTGSSFTSTASMVVLPDSRYGIALMSNSRMPLEADTEAIMEDLVALTRGAPPGGDRLPLALIADLVVLAVALLIAVVGVRAARRAQLWARGRANSPAWHTALRFLPWLLPLLTLVFLPRALELLTGGRGVTFLLLSHIWPTSLAALGLIAATGLAIVTARLLALTRLRRA